MVEINKIYNEDCITGLKKIDTESVDLVFFDPPFNLNKDYGKEINDNIKKNDYLQWQYSILDEAIRILKPTGAIVYHNIPKWAFKIANYLDDKDMVFQNWICWNESGSIPAPSRLYPKHYPILWFSKTNKKTFNKQYAPIQRCRKCKVTVKDYGGKYKDLKEIDSEKVTVISDVWDDIHRIRHNKNKHRNCNELPEALMERIIKLYTNENDIVVDPFTGSGTTLYMAQKLNRNYIGIELNQEYIEIANERLNNIA